MAFNKAREENLLHTMLGADKMTLQILLMKIIGYSVCEIAEKMEVPDQTIYTRLRRLREKIKKIRKVNKNRRCHRLLSVGEILSYLLFDNQISALQVRSRK